MNSVIGALRVVLGMDSASFDKGLNEAQKSLNRFGRDMQKVSAKLTTLGAGLTLGLTVPLVALGAKMTDMAIRAEEMKSAFGVSFGTMSKEVEAWAVKTGDALGRSTEEMQQGALTMHGLFKAGGPATTQTAALAKQFAVLAQDLSSFHDVDPTEALAALKSGLSGEAEPLRRFNVYLTENAVRLQAVKMGLGTMKGELSEVAKIQARAALIMAGTSEAQGDVARTSDSAANQIRRAKAEWQELAVTIGSKIIPALKPVVKGLADIIQGFGTLTPGVQTAVLVFGAVAIAIGPVLIGLGSLVGALGTLSTAFAAATGAAGAAGMTGAMAALLNPVTLIIAAVAALTVGLGLLMYAHTDAAVKADANKKAHERLDPILNVVRESMDKAAASTGELRKSHLEAADAAFIRGEAELEAARKTLAAARANLAAAKKTDSNAGFMAATGNPFPGLNTVYADIRENRADAELKAIEDRLIKAGNGVRLRRGGGNSNFLVIKPSDAFKEADGIKGIGSAVADTGGKTKKAKEDTRDYAEEWDRLRESLMGDNQRALEDRADQVKLLNELMAKGTIGVQGYAEALRLMDERDFRESFKAQDVGPSPTLSEGLPNDKVMFRGQLASTEQVAEFQQQIAGAFRNGLQALKYGGTEGLMEWMADSFTNRLLDNLANDLSKIFAQLANQMSTTNSNGGNGWGQVIGAVMSWFGGSEGFATGGSFKVGGSGGADSKFVGMRLTPGEMVDIRRPGQANDNAAGGGLAISVTPSPLFNVMVTRTSTAAAGAAGHAAYSKASRDVPARMQDRNRMRLA